MIDPTMQMMLNRQSKHEQLRTGIKEKDPKAIKLCRNYLHDLAEADENTLYHIIVALENFIIKAISEFEDADAD